MLETTARDEIAAILLDTDLERKLRRAEALCASRAKIAATLDSGDRLPSLRPGRPADFEVVSASAVPRRPRLGNERGRYLLAHSVGHIELSAIELALTACADFPDQEVGYYRAMLHVAEEEIRHTRMMMRRLEELGGRLGTDPVHLGLWETSAEYDDVIDRLAVVPRILEARGLDVSEGLKVQLRKAGDDETARCLDVIYRDEIGHVAIGSHWYRRICEGHGIDPLEHWRTIIPRFRPGRSMPLDEEGRGKAGFTAEELAALRSD